MDLSEPAEGDGRREYRGSSGKRGKEAERATADGFDRKLYKALSRYFVFYFRAACGLDTDVNSTRCNAL